MAIQWVCARKNIVLPGLDYRSRSLEAHQFHFQCLRFSKYGMAESKHEDDDLALTAGYKAPAQKSLAEIASQDAEDESLRRYKEALLGNVSGVAGSGKKVIVEKLCVVIEGRDDMVMDLTGDLSKLKKSPVTIPEGIQYRLKLEFKCPGEIVPGLRFITKIYRKGVKVDTLQYMVGSYGPNTAEKPVHNYLGDAEEAPAGLLSRGSYTGKSVFIDDDNTIHLQWEWAFDIKKKDK